MNKTAEYKKLEPLIQFEHPQGYQLERKELGTNSDKGELHYIYSLSPLRILKCEVENGKENIEENPKKKKSTSNSDSSESKSKKRRTFQIIKKFVVSNLKVKQLTVVHKRAL